MFFNKKLPWENRESVYKFIKNNINEYGKLTNDTLPDESLRVGENGIRWVAGAMDGVIGHHSSCQNIDKQLAMLIKKISVNARKKDKIEFYNVVVEDNVLSIIDSTLQEIVKLDTRITNNLYEWCKFLVLESPDRGAVKIGIALLGLIDAKEMLEEIKLLGIHEEFTLYVAVAISKLSDNVEQDIWELAKKTDGWGRISLVERLANTENEDIKYWILTQGYKNSILYEYLALIAAETGNLKHALLAEKVDDIILENASIIIRSLMSEGPCDGISIYKDAAETIKLFLKHTVGRRDNLSYLLTYDAIYSYVSDKDIDCAKIKENGWNEEICENIINLVKEELTNNEWKTLVLKRAKDIDDKEFWLTKQAAKILNLDFFDVYWQRLNKEPLNSSNWYDIMDVANINNINDILEFGLKNTSLSQIATGPDTLLGLGLEFNLNNILDFILQKLDQFEGVGIPYIIAGLKSPVIRNRNMAVLAIENWGIDYIDDKLKNIIRESEKIEPDESVRQRLVELINRFIE